MKGSVWESATCTELHHRLHEPLTAAGLSSKVVRQLIEKHTLEEALLQAVYQVASKNLGWAEYYSECIQFSILQM